MSILKLEQNADDVLPWVFDFRRFLSPPDDPAIQGDTITAATAKAQPVSMTVGTPSIEANGTAVRVMLGPSIEEQEYQVTVQITTASGITANAVRTFAIRSDAR
jgi:hypothetical protein